MFSQSLQVEPWASTNPKVSDPVVGTIALTVCLLVNGMPDPPLNFVEIVRSLIGLTFSLSQRTVTCRIDERSRQAEADVARPGALGPAAAVGPAAISANRTADVSPAIDRFMGRKPSVRTIASPRGGCAGAAWVVRGESLRRLFGGVERGDVTIDLDPARCGQTIRADALRANARTLRRVTHPAGTLTATFLMTDIAGSTRMWEQ